MDDFIKDKRKTDDSILRGLCRSFKEHVSIKYGSYFLPGELSGKSDIYERLKLIKDESGRNEVAFMIVTSIFYGLNSYDSKEARDRMPDEGEFIWVGKKGVLPSSMNVMDRSLIDAINGMSDDVRCYYALRYDSVGTLTLETPGADVWVKCIKGLTSLAENASKRKRKTYSRETEKFVIKAQTEMANDEKRYLITRAISGFDLEMRPLPFLQSAMESGSQRDICEQIRERLLESGSDSRFENGDLT